MFLILSLLTQVPSIQDTINPGEYLVTGPFLRGVREGSWRNLPDDTGYVPTEGDSLFSVMATGGWVHWENSKVDSTGWIYMDDSGVDWEFLQDRYGTSIYYASGYAYAEIEVSEKSRALAISKRASFSLNKKSYSGDSYRHGYVQVPVVFEKGINKIWIYMGPGGGYLRFVPIDSDVRLIAKDATLPDLVYLKDNSGVQYGAIPVCNTTEEWLEEAKIIVGGGDFTQNEFDLPPIAPMSFYKAPFHFEFTGDIGDSIEDNKVEMSISAAWRENRKDYTVKLDCIKPDRPYEQTFISKIDSSVQFYAIMDPGDFDETKDYRLVFALHGAGSKGLWHLGQYEQKDWCYMAGPTNRRRYGFDWQDWGRLDALEVYDLVMNKYPEIDDDKVCLTGHSMGGHGTWHVGLTHPDLFCCAAPGAGWTNHELYVPWTWQKSQLFGEAWQVGVRNHALRGDNQLARVENARNLPYYIFQGGADDNVPAFQARLYAKRLSQLGYEHYYHEWPGGGHGWQEPTSPGSEDSVSCVNTPAIMEFFQSYQRDTYPAHVYYRTADLSQESGAYWLDIHTVEDRYKDAVIEGWFKNLSFEILTTNLNRFSLEMPDDWTDDEIKVMIDDDELYIEPVDELVVFEKGKKGWQKAKDDDYPLPHPPIKGAYYSPFILVYGTLGDSSTTERLLSMARNQSQAWWYRANGRVRIVPDSAVTDEMIEAYNLILYGNAEQNAIVAGIEKTLPIRIENDRLVLGEKVQPASAEAALFIYPNPMNPDKYVLVRQGIGEDGLKRSGNFSTMYSGAGLPDYIIWGKDVAEKGWGGVYEAGFFNADWSF